MTPKCYDIPNIFGSLAMDVVSGEMTMAQVAEELNRCNYTPYVDLEMVQKMLEPYIEEIAAKKGAFK